jgi:hypothetical protein
MSLAITPSLQQVYAPIIAFIIAITGLPATQVVQGIPNRVPMPKPGFITVQALFRSRLITNIDIWDEVDTPPVQAGIQEGVDLRVQIDCYGTTACDWANMLSATLRDEYGCTQIGTLAAAQTPPFELEPLYADDARMIPLVAGEEQYEERWSVDAHFQVNPLTTIPQQYADTAKVGLINVDEAYPA